MGVYDRTVEKLHEKKAEAFESMQALMETPQSEWSADDIKQWDKLDADIKQYDSDIDAERKTIDRAARMDQLRGGVHTSRGETHDASGCHIFRDASSGVELRSLAPSESIVSPRDQRDMQQVDAGRILRAMILNRYDDLSPVETRAALGGSDSSGGYLLPTPVSGRIIDLARSASVTQRAGAQILPMTSGELRIARVVGDPTPVWRAEAQTVTSSDITFDAITLRAKTVAAICPISVELLEDAANAQTVLINAISNKLGLAMDQAVLAGAGSANEPLGIRNTTGVNTIGSVGTPSNYNSWNLAIGDIRLANYQGPTSDLAMINHPRTIDTLSNLKTGISSDNTPLMMPSRVAELKQFETTSISIVEGAGAESYSVVGHFPQMIIGVRNSLSIRLATDGTVSDSAGTSWNATSQLLRLVVAYMRIDTACIRPDHFTVLTGITTA